VNCEAAESHKAFFFWSFVFYFKTVSMASHEVMHFHSPGRAEVTRIMLYAVGIDFKDTRFSGPEWPTIKSTTPLVGSVPVLKIVDQSHCQSISGMLFHYLDRFDPML
jgi:hypothetical protein